MAQPRTPSEQPPLSESSQNPDPSSPGAAPGSPTTAEPDQTLSSSSPTVAGQLGRLKDRIPQSVKTFIGFDAESWLGPAQTSKRERLKHLLLNGRFIVLLLAVGSLLEAILGAFSGGAANLGSILIALAICSLCFRLRLITRFVIVALLVPGIVLFLSAALLGKPVYDAGLLILNSVTDPTERTFWVDPNHRDVPGYENMPDRVFVETGDGIQSVDTTTEAGRDLAFWGIKTDLGEKYMQTLGLLLNGPAMVVAGLGIASRLMGITRAPPSISGRPGPFDGLSRRTRIGLIMMTIGLATAIVGTVFGDLLDEIFDDKLYYLPGEGVNREAQGVAFSMLFLYKAKWLGYMAWSLGIILLLIGTPRRQLFAWFDRRALNGGRRFDPILKKTGVWFFSIGKLGAIVQYTGVAGFFAGIRREILLMTTGDMKVLYEEPEWLLTLYSILDLWALASLLGMILVGVGSKTVRKYAKMIYDLASMMGSSGSGSDGGSSKPGQSSGSGGSGSSGSGGSESGEVISGGASAASRAAAAARSGGGGGRGR